MLVDLTSIGAIRQVKKGDNQSRYQLAKGSRAGAGAGEAGGNRVEGSMIWRCCRAIGMQSKVT